MQPSRRTGEGYCKAIGEGLRAVQTMLTNHLCAFAFVGRRRGYILSNGNLRVDLVSTVVSRPPMTRMVTRSHPCESDTELANSQCQELEEGASAAFFLFPWAFAVEKINANLRSSPPYLRAAQRCPKKDIQPNCVLGMDLGSRGTLTSASIFTSSM